MDFSPPAYAPLAEELTAAIRFFVNAGIVGILPGLAAAGAAFWRRKQGLPAWLRVPVRLVLLVYGLDVIFLLVAEIALMVEGLSSGSFPEALLFFGRLLVLNLIGGALWIYVLRKTRPDEPIRLALN